MAAVLVSAAFTSNASAATVSYDTSNPWFPALVFKGSPGEANHLTVSSGGAPLSSDWRITFRDPGHLLGPDLSATDADRNLTLQACNFFGDSVSCTNSYENAMYIYLGDRDDTLSFAPGSVNAYEFTITADGGPGNDLLRGGWAARTQLTLRGGSGNDRLLGDDSTDMIGDAGADTLSLLDSSATSTHSSVSYGWQTSGVSVTLDGIANDGGPGEGDNVDPRIHSVEGSAFDDSLTGNSLPGGHDLNGSDGNDRLEAAGGTGVLNGSYGDDIFAARDGVAQTIRCSAGNDSVVADAADALTDCEAVDQQ